jgi:hypothetical protein
VPVYGRAWLGVFSLPASFNFILSRSAGALDLCGCFGKIRIDRKDCFSGFCLKSYTMQTDFHKCPLCIERIHFILLGGLESCFPKFVWQRYKKDGVFPRAVVEKTHICVFVEERVASVFVWTYTMQHIYLCKSTKHISQFETDNPRSVSGRELVFFGVCQIGHTKNIRENERCSRIYYVFERMHGFFPFLMRERLRYHICSF